MIRVHIICEGQTEETFIKNLLYEPFLSKNICLYPSLIGKPGHKGGLVNFNRLLVDIRNRLLGDVNSYCTTFFDYYGLKEDFPGKSESANYESIEEKADVICRKLIEQLGASIEPNAMKKFIPYVQMHEFEGLLFSDPHKFATGICEVDLSMEFQRIRNQFETPETINDNRLSAPSKRILSLFPKYEKPIYGSLAALDIGLDTIREECKLFNNWLNQLENLSD